LHSEEIYGAFQRTSTFRIFVKRGVYDEDWGARDEVKIDETLGNVRLRRIRPPEADFQPEA